MYAPRALAALACFCLAPVSAAPLLLAQQAHNPQAEFEKDLPKIAQLAFSDGSTMVDYDTIVSFCPGSFGAAPNGSLHVDHLDPLATSDIRLHVMHLAQIVSPELPDRAREEFGVGNRLLQAAQQAATPAEAKDDFHRAAAAFAEAIDQAPWFPDYYLDAALAVQGEGPQYSADAVVLFRWYLANAPQNQTANDKMRISAAINGIAQAKSDAETKFCMQLDESQSWAPLIWEASTGELARVREELEHGAFVDAEDRYGATALIDAAQNGHADVVRLLLEHNADVNATAHGNETALMLAAEWGHLSVVRLLLANGADVSVKGSDGFTALMEAFSVFEPLCNPKSQSRLASLLEMVQALLAHGANANATDNHDFTPIILAAQCGSVDVVKALLAHGADINAISEYGDTALLRARSDPGLVAFLLSHGANVNAKNSYGHTSLMQIAGADCYEPAQADMRLGDVSFLVAHGADVNAKSNEGDTALSLAEHFDNRKYCGGGPVGTPCSDWDRCHAIEKYLRDHGAQE